MRFKLKSRNRAWHAWFAWYPVRVDDHIIWFRYVRRQFRFESIKPFWKPQWNVYYREIRK